MGKYKARKLFEATNKALDNQVNAQLQQAVEEKNRRRDEAMVKLVDNILKNLGFQESYWRTDSVLEKYYAVKDIVGSQKAIFLAIKNRVTNPYDNKVIEFGSAEAIDNAIRSAIKKAKKEAGPVINASMKTDQEKSDSDFNPKKDILVFELLAYMLLIAVVAAALVNIFLFIVNK